MVRVSWLGITLVVALLTAGPASAGDTAGAVYWQATSGPYTITFSERDLSVRDAGGKTLYSARALWDSSAQKMLAADRAGVKDADTLEDLCSPRPDSCTVESTLEVRPLSLVGSILSVEIYREEFHPGAAHGMSERVVDPVDLAHDGKPVSLVTLFGVKEVRDALAGDKVVKEALGGKPAPQSLDALLSAVGRCADCGYALDEKMIEHFAFYSAGQGNVSVRIGLRHNVEAARGTSIWLGLKLPIPASLADALVRAAADHTLLADIDKKARGKATHFTQQIDLAGEFKAMHGKGNKP